MQMIRITASITALLAMFLLSGAAVARTTDPPSSNAPEARTESEAPAVKPPQKKKKRPKRRCRAYAEPRYKQMVRNWRKVPKIPGPRWREGYRDLTLYSINHGERVRVFPFLPDGTLDPEALARIEPAMRDRNNDATHAVNPRLVKLLYKLAVHFKARQITVISGYRDPGEATNESHHADGSAVDFMIPGVKLAALAKVARRLGHVGVGYYPTSGFVHLDVRDRSYFWADPSGPGYSGCHRQIMPMSIWKFDARWSPEDDEPEAVRNKKGNLLGAAKSETDGGVETPVGEP